MPSTKFPPVEYRRLGQSGLRVSVPIIGAMSFGSRKWAPWVIEEEDTLKVLKAAWDRGVNTIDTANVYSNGESERIIAKFIKKYNIPRHRIIIFTKCCFLTHDNVGTRVVLHPGSPGYRDIRDYVNQSGLSRAAIFNQVEASLARLETPYIDLLLIHRYDPETPPEETMRALHDLVVSGRVRYIGASSMRTWQFAELNRVAEINGWTQFISMQSEYSLLYREDEREMIPYCKAKGVGLIPWAPLHRGDLARQLDISTLRGNETRLFEGKPSKVDEAIISRVKEISEKRGWTMAQVALAWISKRVSSPIVGMSSLERLEEAITTGKTLTSEEEKYLEELYIPKAVRGHA